MTVKRQPEQLLYELLDDQGERIGKIDYRERSGVITMWHTEVDKAHQGEGLAAILVAAALDDARERGLTVKPTCPYIARYIERHPDYADLLQGGSA